MSPCDGEKVKSEELERGELSSAGYYAPHAWFVEGQSPTQMAVKQVTPKQIA